MKHLLLIISLVLLYTSLALGGNTGKILGRVTDKNSGEALVGVNVFLVDQPFGASTDGAGEYFILNIPPGEYTVECSYVGYQKVQIQKVVVQSDQTTSLDIELSETVMELDEKIIVTAERPLVTKDLTSSKKITSAEEIKALPVETFSGIMLTQAGVTQGAGGELHIRGGRSSEISYMVDGVSVANPFATNGLGTSISNNAIQEMSVVSGAFNAEYGNAMSGIVNFTTKDGSKKFKSFLSYYTGDYVSSNNDIFTNIDDVSPFAKYNIEGTLSGPVSFLGKRNNTFFLSARYSDSEGYLYGVREHTPFDSANFEPKAYVIEEKDEGTITKYTVYKDEWYIENNGDGKFVPMNPSKGLNLMAKLKIDLAPGVIMRLQSIFNDSERKSYSHRYKFNPDGVSTRYSNSSTNSMQLVHTLSNSTFYEMKFAYNYREYDRYVVENPTVDNFAPTNRIKGSPKSTTFRFGGMERNPYFEQSKTVLGKFDFTSQMNKKNLVKTGIEARINVLNQETYYVGYDRNLYQVPTKVNTGKYVRYPRQVSAYVQDKLEYDDMIINAGLRYDYFFSDAPYAVNELQPDGERKLAEAKHMWSPRLGISFPITETGIIHFSYGHFYQMPSMSSMYSNPNFIIPLNGTPTVGNANLDPEKTITYEFGLQQQLSSLIALNVTAYYKNVRNLLAWQTIKFQRLTGDEQNYRIRRNQDYGNIRGLEISLSKRAGQGENIAASIDYTYSVAEGNDNDPAAFFYNQYSGRESLKETIPLDWDQPHNLKGTVTYFPFKGAVFSMIGRLSSGYPYTPVVANSNYDSKPNSARKPMQKYVDIRASYEFKMANMKYQLFLKVYNLFDTLNERYVYNDTGRAGSTYLERSNQELPDFTKHYGEEGVHTYDEYIVRPHYYSAPREVRVGLSVNF